MFRSEFSSPKNVPLPNFSNAKQCQQAGSVCPDYRELLIFLDSKTEGSSSADTDTFKPGSHNGKCWVWLGWRFGTRVCCIARTVGSARSKEELALFQASTGRHARGAFVILVGNVSCVRPVKTGIFMEIRS